MTTYDLSAMSLLKLVEAYGNECSIGGAGYTADDSDEMLAEIKARLDVLYSEAHGFDWIADVLDGKEPVANHSERTTT